MSPLASTRLWKFFVLKRYSLLILWSSRRLWNRITISRFVSCTLEYCLVLLEIVPSISLDLPTAHGDWCGMLYKGTLCWWKEDFFLNPSYVLTLWMFWAIFNSEGQGWKQRHCIAWFNVWLGCNALLLPRGQDGLRLIPYPLPTILCWSCENKRWSSSCPYSGVIGRLSGSLWRSSVFHSHNWAKLWTLADLNMMTTWQDTRGWELRSDANCELLKWLPIWIC